jgi:hypothetical protein
MVRGLYDLRVDAAVFGKHTKVLVSRDDLVQVRVVTPLDIAVFALAVLLIGACLVLLGGVVPRRRLRRRRGSGE